MPIQIIWGNDLNACNQFIEQFIKKNVSEIWQEINLSQLNGTDINQIFIAFEEILTPPMGDGSRVVVLKNNPMFTNKNEELRNKFEKIYENIPNNNYLILQSIKKPDSRLKSTKFIQSLIKKDLANETSFSLPDIWDFEGQKRYLQLMANSMSLSLDENVAELIINSVGNDSLQLINELTKAKIYLSTSGHASNSTLQITQKNVKEIFNNHYSNIFRIIDFLLEKKRQKSFIEVKNVTLFRDKKTAEFPDAITSRGSKHLLTLIDAIKKGYKTYLIFLVQIQNMEYFKIAKDIDSEYYENYLKAKKAGVNFLAYRCKISSKEIFIDKKIKIINE